MSKSKLPDRETEFERKRQDKWLDAFDQASPRERHRLLLEALESPRPFLTPDALAFAAATVNQMLAHSNLLTELGKLAGLLQSRAPEAHTMLLPALQMLELNQALFRREADRLPALMQVFLGMASHLPPGQWQMILDQLAGFGYTALAAECAAMVQQKLGPGLLEIEEDLDFALENHQLYRCFETYWNSQQGASDRKELSQAIRAALEDETDAKFFLRQADCDYAQHLARLKESLMQRDVIAALSHAQLAFGRWMHQQHELPLYVSARMLAAVFVIWTQPPLKGSLALDRLAKVEPRQLREAFEIYEFEGADLLESFFFIWGLPHVYAWLESLGHVGPRESEKIAQFAEACKEEIYNSRNLALWSFDFVHRWPKPPHLSPEAFAAEVARFRATHDRALPLSDNPADNALFDEALDEDAPLEGGLTEEMVDELLDHLATLRPDQREHLLSVMALEFGPEAATEVRQLLKQQHPELDKPGGRSHAHHDHHAHAHHGHDHSHESMLKPVPESQSPGKKPASGKSSKSKKKPKK